MQLLKLDARLKFTNPSVEEAKEALEIAEQQLNSVKDIIKIIESKDIKASPFGFNYYMEKDYHLKGLEDNIDFEYEDIMKFLKKEGFKSKTGRQSIITMSTVLGRSEDISPALSLNMILDIAKDSDIIDKFINLHPEHMIWIENPCPETKDESIILEEVSKTTFMFKTMEAERGSSNNPLEELLKNAVPIAMGSGPEDLLESLKKLKKRFNREEGELDKEDLENLARNTNAEC